MSLSLPFSAKKLSVPALLRWNSPLKSVFFLIEIIYEKEPILYLLKHFRASDISFYSFLFFAAASMPHPSPSPSHLPSPEHSIEYWPDRQLSVNQGQDRMFVCIVLLVVLGGITTSGHPAQPSRDTSGHPGCLLYWFLPGCPLAGPCSHLYLTCP